MKAAKAKKETQQKSEAKIQEVTDEEAERIKKEEEKRKEKEQKEAEDKNKDNDNDNDKKTENGEVSTDYHLDLMFQL